MDNIDDKDILETMRADLQRALKKPRQERRWAMAIDTKKCIGCHACTTGCMSENRARHHNRKRVPKSVLSFVFFMCG